MKHADPIQSVLDRNLPRPIAYRVSAELIATRKQAVAYLDDIGLTFGPVAVQELLRENFAYTQAEAERVYTEWLADV